MSHAKQAPSLLLNSVRSRSTSTVKRNEQYETFVVSLALVAKTDGIFQVTNCDRMLKTGSLPLTRRQVTILFGGHDTLELQHGSLRAMP